MSATAVIEAICERPPDSTTMAVLGGLESTEKEPISPATMLPAPTPAKSRLTSSGSPFSEGKVLATADVCMMQTMATTRASGTRWPNSAAPGRDGSAGCGSATGRGPSRLTPRALEVEQRHDEARPDHADQCSRNLGADLAVPKVTASTPTPSASAYGLVSPRRPRMWNRRSRRCPCSSDMPSSVGSSPTMMWMEMPARKPSSLGSKAGSRASRPGTSRPRPEWRRP